MAALATAGAIVPEAVRVGRSGRRGAGATLSLWLLAAAAPIAPVAAAPVAPPTATPLTPGDLPPATPDGRMLGHLPYAEARRSDLIAAPPGFAIGPACLIHRDAAPDLTRMLAAAALAPGVGRSLRGVSCFRSIAHQRAVFCRDARPGRCADPAQRARFVGPPGYSEHATGYAIDFGARPSPGCGDVDSCLAQTPAGRWLLRHATEFGFELSFPAGNAQGVTWEPWHWRWVGASSDAIGGPRARLAFARARARYAASPGIADIPQPWPEPWPLAAPIHPPISPPAMLPPPGRAASRRR